MTQTLTVEDNPDHRAPVHHRLQKVGLKVAETAIGEAALRLLRQRNFHPVLLDIVLPRISDWEVARRMSSEPGLDRSLIFLGRSSSVTTRLTTYASQIGSRCLLAAKARM
jgi:CheY-like chemotaxis protein